MSAPFSSDQFLAIFVTYNAAIWPAQIVAYVLGSLAVAALWLKPMLSKKLILSILALMCAWNGIGFQLIFFASINPAAKVFAGIFLFQAVLLAGFAATGKDASFRFETDFRSIAGLCFVVYAMLIYPILGIFAGHGLMAGPMFGVAPCPTTIFTIGMLLMSRGRKVAFLAVIPFLWSLIGLSAALQLGMVEDLGLPVGGLVLVIVLIVEIARARKSHDTSTTAEVSVQR